MGLSLSNCSTMKSLSFLLLLVCLAASSFANQCIDGFGRDFGVGEQFMCSDDCNRCLCQVDVHIPITDLLCPAIPGQRICKYGFKILRTGQSVPCTDGCNLCTCSDGKIVSTEKFCGK